MLLNWIALAPVLLLVADLRMVRPAERAASAMWLIALGAFFAFKGPFH